MKTKNFLLIGLSTFNQYLAKKLYSNGSNVIVIDKNKELIQAIKDEVSTAVLADITDLNVLNKFAKNFEGIILISLGNNFEKTVVTLFHLKKLELKNIYVKATNEEQAEILKLLGADEIIIPERDMALKLADSFLNPEIIETIKLSDKYKIIETTAPDYFIDKTLIELKIRNLYNINVIAIKKSDSNEIIISEIINYRFKNNDKIIALGSVENIKKFEDSF
ncbi:MAG TPA: TrkA family potassium uptake protein [bacterium]|nr:TrkA family potassium uptake protein [bacterium]HPP87774.1 TrkA family potassium uptake protein [bacterium]